MTTLRIDLETYSGIDLRKAGMHKYVSSPDFEIMLLAYAFDDQPVRLIDLKQGEELPEELTQAMFDTNVIKAAYNAAFEIACLSRFFNQELEIREWRCTSVHALYLGMPGNLGDVGKVVGLGSDKQKISQGSNLIRYFCVPCKPTQKNGGRKRNLPQHDPEKWQLFRDYCIRDVEAERAIALKMAKFPVPDREWQLWAIDQEMNRRGIMLDLQLIKHAIECDDIFKQRTAPSGQTALCIA